MPLFKSKPHNTTTHHDEPLTTHGDHTGHHHVGTGAGIGGGTGAAGMDQPGYSSHTAGHHAPHHTPATGAGYGNEPGMNNLGHNDYEPVGVGSSANDPYSAAGVGHNSGHVGHNPGHQSSIPPTSALHAGSAAKGERHSGSSMTGKMERKVGDLLGSKSLQAKGMQKEQEAQALKVQSSELAEAERLEREAVMRRERAVAHGAHPENKHLGAGFTD
ncbi:hypothetical protein PQX77_002628 [Marasmius sp. AFHP31]|nr:hypothetical protein PQX77_002628 [Marasmius sp. AFHP31]